MKTYAEMLEGKRVFYRLVGTHIKDKPPAINMHIDTPEIYIPANNVSGKEIKGCFLAVLMHDMPAEKVRQNK